MPLSTLSTSPQNGDRCLSVRNPYAWLIVQGMKKYENRSKPTKFRGRLWIHSSLSLAFRDWSEIVGGDPIPLSSGVTLDDGTELPSLASLPCGVILGSIEVIAGADNAMDLWSDLNADWRRVRDLALVALGAGETRK